MGKGEWNSPATTAQSPSGTAAMHPGARPAHRPPPIEMSDAGRAETRPSPRLFWGRDRRGAPGRGPRRCRRAAMAGRAAVLSHSRTFALSHPAIQAPKPGTVLAKPVFALTATIKSTVHPAAPAGTNLTRIFF